MNGFENMYNKHKSLDLIYGGKMQLLIRSKLWFHKICDAIRATLTKSLVSTKYIIMTHGDVGVM